MFFVFNKDKINSYLISVATVALLFAMPFVIKDKSAYETSATVNQLQENETKKEIISQSTANEEEETTIQSVENRNILPSF